MPTRSSRIRVGIGGWTYAPWRGGVFYPRDLAQSRELEFASRRLSAIEINATYHGPQKPATFAKWRDATPEGFVFPLKASRYATTRRVLADAGEAVERFVTSGIAELGPKLGPIVWQFLPTKRFEPDDFAAFLQLLPQRVDGLKLRHVIDVRHDSFRCEDYLALARRHRVATVFTDSSEHPSFADLSADFVYARLMRADARYKHGYPPQALDGWADCAKRWAAGGEPAQLPRVGAADAKAKHTPRDVFVFFINGAKERAPAAALALIERLA